MTRLELVLDLRRQVREGEAWIHARENPDPTTAEKLVKQIRRRLVMAEARLTGAADGRNRRAWGRANG